jgi:hypothetical protein
MTEVVMDINQAGEKAGTTHIKKWIRNYDCGAFIFLVALVIYILSLFPLGIIGEPWAKWVMWVLVGGIVFSIVCGEVMRYRLENGPNGTSKEEGRDRV